MISLFMISIGEPLAPISNQNTRECFVVGTVELVTQPPYSVGVRWPQEFLCLVPFTRALLQNGLHVHE